MNTLSIIRNLWRAVSAVAVSAAILSCSQKDELQPVQEEILAVEINMEEITIQTGGEMALEAIIIPTTIDTTVIWTSADESIATVDENGLVKGLKQGETTVSARCGEFIGRCNVNVVDPVVQDVILNKTNITICVDETDTLTYEIIPANVGEVSVVWSSADERIASVSDMGVVRARSVGSTVITLSANGINAQCYVKVEPVEVTSITLSKNELTLEEGATELLTATVAPVNVTYNDVAWESSDLNVATVIAGRVTAVKAGSATITASCGGMEATCKVTVTEAEGVRYAVGDVFYDPEGRAGIVFYITDNGMHGKAIGLKATPFSTSYYSTESVYIGATSVDDGRQNTEAVRNTANYETAYPAFKWLEDYYGSEWYVPAQNELAELMPIFGEIRMAVTNEGGDYLNPMQTSSTETNAGNYTMVMWDFGDGYSTTPSPKSEGYQMCAVYEF